jgi:hypothetical protein
VVETAFLMGILRGTNRSKLSTEISKSGKTGDAEPISAKQMVISRKER